VGQHQQVNKSYQVNDGCEVVRIPTISNPRCINSKTDEITLSVYRVTVERTGGFFTEDNQAGIAVLSVLNADGQTPAKTPSVNVISISGEHRGQVFLPWEYLIASQLSLTQPGTGGCHGQLGLLGLLGQLVDLHSLST
jgi:hypothetical protein